MEERPEIHFQRKIRLRFQTLFAPELCCFLAQRCSMAVMNVQIPDDSTEVIERIARENSIPRNEVLRRTLALLRINEAEKKNGLKLAFVNGGDQLVSRIHGL
jgi:hypothetical protein